MRRYAKHMLIRWWNGAMTASELIEVLRQAYPKSIVPMRNGVP
jgi:hypothetical protein